MLPKKSNPDVDDSHSGESKGKDRKQTRFNDSFEKIKTNTLESISKRVKTFIGKVQSIITKPLVATGSFLLAVLFFITSVSSCNSMLGESSKVKELQKNIQELESEKKKLKDENDDLLDQIDDLENGPDRLLQKITSAYQDKDWDKVVNIYDQIKTKYAGTSQDNEAKSMYEEAKSELEKIKQAEEEKKKAEEEERKKKEEEEKKQEEERKQKEEEEKRKQEEEAARQAEEERKKQEEIAKRTTAQKNAISQAESYLKYSAFSRQGLIDQLEYEGYSNEDATYAVDHITVDWNEQAYKMAKSYLNHSSFSESGLISQLVYEGFSQEQAAYGVSKAYTE